ncbi:MAG: hypothetical protein GY950_03015 [bacterium]|nr:hypothetical protein [bacterium]
MGFPDTSACLFFVFFLSVSLGGDYQWKIDDLAAADTVGEYRIAPTGGLLLWTKRQVDLKSHARYHTIYLTTLGEKGADRRLTRDRVSMSVRYGQNQEITPPPVV